MNQEKKLFNLVNGIGENCEGDIHIIDNSPEYPNYVGEKDFRVYFKSGTCFDIKKMPDIIDEDTDKVISWEYSMDVIWERFDGSKAIDFIKIINTNYSTTF